MSRPPLITVQGTYLKPSGIAETGTVTFSSRVFVRDSSSDDVMAPGQISARLDPSGDVSLQVPATDASGFSPSGWTYRVVVELSGGTTVFAAAVPAASPGGILDLSDLLPAQPTGGELYAPVGHTHTDYLDGAEVAQVVATALSPYIDVTELTAALTAYLPKLTPVVTDSTFTVRRTGGGVMRWRATGGALDIDKGPGDVIVSSYSDEAMNNDQRNLMRWRGDGVTMVGYTEFATGAYAGGQAISPDGGFALLGGKNGLPYIRLVGRKATAGAPTTGAWDVGDAVIDSAGAWHLCTSGGTPGTWT